LQEQQKGEKALLNYLEAKRMEEEFKKSTEERINLK